MSDPLSTDRRCLHTAGPWRLQQESIDPHWHIVTAVGGRIMANVHIENGNAMDVANGHLIAAAPEMLDALRLVRRLWANDDVFQETRVIDAAIAKAEGR